MKFLHVSDIHLGKRLYGCSLNEDHEAVLEQILGLAARSDVDAVLVAGDVYNRAQPQPDAISLFSAFLTRLAGLGKPVFVVRGNHDGEAQLAYAAPLLASADIHVSEVFSGGMAKITLSDEFGPVNVYLLPFIRPVQARKFYPDAGIETYADAVSAVIGAAGVDESERNILVTHQYVLGAQTSDSEERSIGGVDQIPPAVFSAFDYVALGHLHKSQTMASGKIRYCGAPLVYSFDECGQEKSATIVTVGAKGEVNGFELVPFEPLHPCRRLEGTLAELCAQPRSEDYVQIHLTDAVRPLDPVGTLKLTYPNLLNLTFARIEAGEDVESVQEFEPALDPLEHFIAFYAHQNKKQPSDAQIELVRGILQEGGEGE
ncbi:MAG: exonuclease SbcCD subunit D [Clostridia bacterium]|nr:exonuclease SbcCD subunit D [Clostridia bacterium]